MMKDTVLQTLYGMTAKGAIKVWDIKATTDSIITSYGQVGGRLTSSERKVTPKNVGRSNETTHAQQAIKEAQSAWQKKKDSGYTTDASRAGEDTVTRRMRCYVYDDSLINNSAIYYAQPKLNGVKCFVKKLDEDTISYQSSGGKQYETMHKFDEEFLNGMAIGEELDTEIYFHGASLQEISSAVKKENELTKYLQIHAYDVVDEGMFKYRLESLKTIVNNINSNDIILVETKEVSIKLYEVYHTTLLKQGYEGSILRSPQGFYAQGCKSINVLKRKDWSSNEFEITGYLKDVLGRIIFTCKVDDNKSFNVVPKGTHDSRKRMYADGDNYIGSMLTVLYSDVSDVGIPQGNPVGETVRMVEDIDTNQDK